jgi:hypothetical protein
MEGFRRQIQVSPSFGSRNTSSRHDPVAGSRSQGLMRLLETGAAVLQGHSLAWPGDHEELEVR